MAGLEDSWTTIHHGKKKEKKNGKSGGKAKSGNLHARKTATLANNEFIRQAVHPIGDDSEPPNPALVQRFNRLVRGCQDYLDTVATLTHISKPPSPSDAASTAAALPDANTSCTTTLLSPTVSSIVSSLYDVPAATPPPVLVMYGIGDFSSYILPLIEKAGDDDDGDNGAEAESTPVDVAPSLLSPPFLQLLFALRFPSTHRYYYDPCMSIFEMSFLQSLDIIPLTTTGINGDFVVKDALKELGEGGTDRAVFFMPHCPEKLYAAVLEANEGNLKNVAIVGNDLDQYKDMLRGEDREACPISIVEATGVCCDHEERAFRSEELVVVGGGGGIGGAAESRRWALDKWATEDGKDVADRLYRSLHHTAIMKWVIP
jgi:hypothetical protein